MLLLLLLLQRRRRLLLPCRGRTTGGWGMNGLARWWWRPVHSR